MDSHFGVRGSVQLWENGLTMGKNHPQEYNENLALQVDPSEMSCPAVQGHVRT